VSVPSRGRNYCQIERVINQDVWQDSFLVISKQLSRKLFLQVNELADKDLLLRFIIGRIKYLRGATQILDSSEIEGICRKQLKI